MTEEGNKTGSDSVALMIEEGNQIASVPVTLPVSEFVRGYFAPQIENWYFLSKKLIAKHLIANLLVRMTESIPTQHNPII